ncbi:DEAD/DEAH box helicase [Salipiger marinus]|uniref:ATP-dependent RNA helicase RhlE n=1 Tax=Salipiger marinus TaxID=555512 RepID=A0A1G8RA75_9RHOB|nr:MULTISPECIES: DEAD/DEAH box helicase [Salipiger]MEB3419367.1 DEAD/DEAH box helicase [Salipiger manganoxidans]SDJ13887.1 ATP-dependent RNA helicase RhlE [Salipiger marinus]HBM59955.1 ATP-dependent helicase [Citreicella sp.]HBT02144.1 ATP-dependent helicase [Citreicella sp.]
MSEFQSLGLAASLIEALNRAALTEPTPIQSQAIPLALAGHDVLGLAQTGTGKTFAFGLPLIHHLLSAQGKPAPKSARALILAPTRELVNQIADSLRVLTTGGHLRVATVVGGQSINRQIGVLSKGTDILVATPGRLIDLMEREAVLLGSVTHLVLDEADQMLDLGFIHALRKIAPRLGTPRQTMLFSATMPKQMEELSRAYLKDPKRVQVAPPGKAADKVTQSVHFVDKNDKPTKLREILSRDRDALTLVFARTKHGAERLMKGLKADGFNAASIHGNKSQGQRDRAIKAFRDGEITVLVATDVAARGIDIPGVAYVVNFDLPEVPDNYVHRIGRTARAGREGEAIAFCCAEEVDLLRQIQKLMKIDIPVASGVMPKAVAPSSPSRGPRGGQGHGRGGQGQGAGRRGGAKAPAAFTGEKSGGARRRRGRSAA